MAPGRTETIRRLFERFNEGVDDVPEDLVAPEIEFVSPLTQVRGRPYRGYDDARQWLRDVTEQFERWSYEIADVREEGDVVIATGVVHVKGKASGVELDQPATWVASFADDGRIVRVEISTEPSVRG